MEALGSLLPLVVLLGLAYLLFIRPTRKRARQVQELQAALSAGDEIMLSSGIFGRVVSIEDVQVRVEVSPDVVLTVHRGAVEKMIRDEPVDPAADTDIDTDTDTHGVAQPNTGTSTSTTTSSSGEATDNRGAS